MKRRAKERIGELEDVKKIYKTSRKWAKYKETDATSISGHMIQIFFHYRSHENSKQVKGHSSIISLTGALHFYHSIQMSP